MDPKAIVDVFKRGHSTTMEATILLVRCAEEWDVRDVVKEIPETLAEDFRKFIKESPLRDISTIGLDGLVLKREWIERFKAFYLEKGG